MAIVVDINCLASVFIDTDEKHGEYKPVKEFITEGPGFLVYGGTRYKNELENCGRFLKLILALRKGGRAISIKDKEVDRVEETVRRKVDLGKCDDPHIVALLSASNCALLCSRDKRSFPFIRNRALYHRNNGKVRIYSSSQNRRILIKQRRKLWNRD